MRRRRKSDEFAETVIVQTDDGKTFRCSFSLMGREADPRWILIDEHAEQYVGPIVEPDHSPDAVQRQIAEWWAERNPRPSKPYPTKNTDVHTDEKKAAPSK